MVFGGGGQVGCHLIEMASATGHDLVGLTHEEVDICDAGAVGDAIAGHSPTCIVNAAAYTAVDKAESDAMRAFAVNRDGASVVAEAAAKVKIPLIHLSTDYVFDGSAHVPYQEDDKVNPQGSYATSKEAGGRAVRSANDRHLILRTAWVYGPFGTNFVKTMLRLGAEREELRVVDDQTGRPTSTEDLAGAILTLVDSVEKPGFSGWGTYHYVGADTVTWYGFATMIFAEAARFGRKVPQVAPIATADFPTAAPRPAYSVLETAKLERTFGIKPRPLRASLVATLERVFRRGESGMKGIILAGGSGSRLYPITIATSKQLMAVYNKPLIYYPLSVLMLAGIRDVLIVSTPEDQDRFVRLLGDGSRIGMSFSYAAQPKPEGLAQAFIIGREFVGNRRCALVLGDNMFYGTGLTPLLQRAMARASGCTVFAYLVNDPERYGVVEFDDASKSVGIVEKPISPKSHWAVTGLYFYDNRVLDIAANLKPSPRGELEITDVNLAYLALGELACERTGRGFAWLDTGTPDSILDAAEFVRTIEQRQGWMIACIEEITYRGGFIDAEQLLRIAASLKNTYYGRYLEAVAQEARHQY